MVVLRQAREWRLAYLLEHSMIQGPKDEIMERGGEVPSCFQAIAKREGSAAMWLYLTGTLVTPDDYELEKDFPYELWLEQAADQVLNMKSFSSGQLDSKD
jgi:hypothetical protein